MDYQYRIDDRVHFNGEWHAIVAVGRAPDGVKLKLVREAVLARVIRGGSVVDCRIVSSDRVTPSEAVKKRSAMARTWVHEPKWRGASGALL